MTRMQTAALGVFVAGLAIAYGMALLVNGHAVSSTAPARAGTSSSSPARAPEERAGGGDMANGSPAALSLNDGGGDRGDAGGQQPAPASTTVVSAVVAEVPTFRTATPQPLTSTVIISAQPPPAGTLEAQVRAAVVAYFPASQVETAMRVAYCESRYQPWAVEASGSHYGVFQLDPSLHGSVPADVDGQVRQAAALWAKAGWSPWSCK